MYLPIGAVKVEKYCRKFGAELQLDWQFIALVRTGWFYYFKVDPP